MQLSLRTMQIGVGRHTSSPTWKTLMHSLLPALVGTTLFRSTVTGARYDYIENEI
jgi:hypothetical protein